MKTVAIITAAGNSKRMGKPKLFIELFGRTILERTLSVFEESSMIDEIILVINEADIAKAQKFKFSKLRKIVPGGKERQNSVYNGLSVIPDEAEIVLIHDGARPFVTQQMISAAVEEAEVTGAVVVGVPVKDTIKRVVPKIDKVMGTLNREELWTAQTPQAFRKEVIVSSYENGVDQGLVTDDATLVEKMGIQVKMIPGNYSNIKITTPGDLIVARMIMQKNSIGKLRKET
ncbi:MAG: 2-C-methyl-D-erythritol 4-phosphate cytidylyltransferase [bacterium]